MAVHEQGVAQMRSKADLEHLTRHLLHDPERVVQQRLAGSEELVVDDHPLEQSKKKEKEKLRNSSPQKCHPNEGMSSTL
jgi:hypothetical protein